MWNPFVANIDLQNHFFLLFYLGSLYDEFGRCEGKWMYIFVQTSSEDILVMTDKQGKKSFISLFVLEH